MRQSIIILILMLSSFLAAFDVDRTGSARLSAMGNSGIILHDTVDCIFLNPASLNHPRGGSRFDVLYGFFNKFRADGYYVHSFAVQLPELPVAGKNIYSGVTFVLESADNVASGEDLSRSFDLGLSLASPQFWRLTFGADLHFRNIKLSEEGEDLESFNIFQARFGMIMDFNVIQAAATLATPETAGDKVWENLTLGIGVKPTANSVITSDFRFVRSRINDYKLQFIYSAGIESIVRGFLGLRLGMLNQKLTAGAGIKYKFFSLDYSFQFFLSGIHRVSVIFRI